MTKKKNLKQRKKSKSISEKVLPQNILFMGEHVEENKNIYIAQPVYKQIHKFTQNKTTNESGGVLVGNVVEACGKVNILVYGFVEAKYCEATPTTLTFTHETWSFVHKEMDKKFPGQKIVGWIHTHPNFGIFLSEYDKFIQENFFKEEHQIAYVVDPIQHIEGFYFWVNGKIERCKGFYKFDKMGVKLESAVDTNVFDGANKLNFRLKDMVIGALVVCIVVLFFTNLRLNKKIDRLQTQQDVLVTSANQALDTLQQKIKQLEETISTLKQQEHPPESVEGEETKETDSEESPTEDPINE